jgi:hypothetical protein
MSPTSHFSVLGALLTPQTNATIEQTLAETRAALSEPAGLYFEGLSPTGQYYLGVRIQGRTISQLLASRGALTHFLPVLRRQYHGNYSLLVDVDLLEQGSLSVEFFPDSVASIVLHQGESHFPQDTYATLDEALYALHLQYGQVGVVPTPIAVPQPSYQGSGQAVTSHTR